MSRLEALARRYGLDALIVLAAIESSVETAFEHDSQGSRMTPWFTVPAIALVVLPLLARRRFPFAAPAAVWLVAAALSFVDGQLIVSTASASVAGVIAAFLLGNLRDDVQARLGLVVSISGAAIVVYNDPGHAAGELVFIPLLFTIGWLAGYAMRGRTEQAEAAEARAARAEQEREAAARLAVAEERARIARELHDIVAHSVSVMVLHTGTVRRKLPDEYAEDREALTEVERTGRAALAEMRRLLGAMRNDGDGVELAPQPGLGDLDALVEEVGRAGLPVRLSIEGEPVPLPSAVELSAYRIVQEGLTNVLKHAGATEAEVDLRFDAGQLQIDVRDDGAGDAGGDGLGHGLVGVRERVKIFGGEMTTGPAAGGGFVLTTRLPIDGRTP